MLSAPACPFGASWEDLKLRDLRSFLATSPTESAVWEAKQHDTKAKLASFIRKESCGFANRRGGYLVLGAEELSDGGWRLSGVDVPKVRELHDWAASVLLELSPAPFFDVREWGLPSGRRVAVLRIDPSPIPPVSVNGVIYIRHGTQTRRANGTEIGRLAEQGRRAQNKTERLVRKVAKEDLGGWAPFSLAIGRLAEREINLQDPNPERVAYAELERVLRARWRKRKLTLLTWGDREVTDLASFALKPVVEKDYSGWRAAWEVEDIAQTERARAAIKRRSSRPRRLGGPSVRFGEKLYFLLSVEPTPVSSAALYVPLAAMGPDPIASYGAAAIRHARMVLPALITTELALGAEPTEQLFIHLLLNVPWAKEQVSVERWASLDLNARAWAEDVEREAATKMLLDPPPH